MTWAHGSLRRSAPRRSLHGIGVMPTSSRRVATASAQ